jgi:hypothetical protein
MAAPHSIAAARMLTRNLREHGSGLNGWFAARDFQGLNQGRIERSHQMVLVSCDEGQSNRTLYTIYPARDDFPLK